MKRFINNTKSDIPYLCFSLDKAEYSRKGECNPANYFINVMSIHYSGGKVFLFMGDMIFCLKEEDFNKLTNEKL